MKIQINNEIASKLKEWRVKNNIKAKDVANYIDKSSSYITKLEKGEINFVEADLLEKIVIFINDDENAFEDFLISATKEMPPDYFDKSLWLMNFDTIERKIPIPSTLIDYIINKMDELNIDIDSLIKYVNLNEDLESDFFNKLDLSEEEVVKNIWHEYVPDDKERCGYYIVLDLKYDELHDVLKKSQDKCNYTFMYSIVYHLLKKEKKDTDLIIDTEDVASEAKSILQSYKFLSLEDKTKFEKHAESYSEFKELISEFDVKNRELINQLVGKISILSELDIKYANEKLKKMVRNFEIDSSFAISYMAISLESFEDKQFSTKREFLDELQKLIKFYEGKDDELQIEKY